jgi:hypothetical protein
MKENDRNDPLIGLGQGRKHSKTHSFCLKSNFSIADSACDCKNVKKIDDRSKKRYNRYKDGGREKRGRIPCGG